GGLPPLSGFWGKFILAKAGFESEQALIVAVSLVVGLLTLFSMTKIWTEVFWAKKPEPPVVATTEPFRYNQSQVLRYKYLMIIPVVILAGLTLYIGLFPSLLIDISMKAAEQLLNP